MEVLREIVTESLVAFPDDAHIKVLIFLSAAGATDDEKKRVQQAWSAVTLASEAFGRRNKRPIDPVLFGDELIRELAYGDKELARLDKLIGSFKTVVAEQQTATTPVTLKNLAELKKPGGPLALLQSMTKIGRELTAALNTTYETVDVAAGSHLAKVPSASNDKAIMEWRRSCRGGKFVWHGRKSANASTLYVPLGSQEHGCVETVYGEVAFKSTDDKGRATSNAIPAVGVKVTTKQPSLLSRAWTSYQCLHEVVSAEKQQLQLFPTPLGVQRETGAATSASASNITCVFELPNCRSLSPLLGPALSTFLRKYPSVVLTWCAQLGIAARTLRTCRSGRLVRSPMLSDCFVKDNGQLLVGNIAFETTLGIDAASTADAGQNTNDLSAFILQLLSSTLSLSRRLDIVLATASSGGDLADYSTIGGADDIVASIMEGCEIKLIFSGHSCRGVSLDIMGEKVGTNGSASTRSATDASKSRLQIVVQGEAGVASVTSSSWKSTETSVTVKAMSAGLLLLRAFTLASLGESGGESVAGRRASTVRIVVVPVYPVMATELQEVICLANNAYASNNCNGLLNAQSLKSPCQATEDERSVMTDWIEVASRVSGVLPSTTKFDRTGSM